MGNMGTLSKTLCYASNISFLNKVMHGIYSTAYLLSEYLSITCKTEFTVVCGCNKKSLVQEVRQKSDILERRSMLQLLFTTWPLSHCATVRGHLTPKMNIAFFIRNLMLNIFLFNNFFERSNIF